MPVIAARIDNRLLHGIVATQWVSEYRPQRLMVINDEYANDPTKKAAMRMAKPAGVALSIISEETALANFTAGKYDDHTVFVVTKSPVTVKHLQDAGQHIPVLVVGGTASPAEDVSATQVSRRAYVLDSEISAYRSVADAGTAIEVRYVPADTPVPLSSLVAM